MRRRILLISFLIAIVLSLFLSTPSNTVRAQDNACDQLTTISYGQTVTGSLDDVNYITGYCFKGTTGDKVTINLIATSGDLDTYLGLSDDTGSTVYAENDDADSGTDSQIIFTLPEDGQYVIVVTRFGLDEGTSTGNFSLSLSSDSGTTLPADEGEDVSIYVTCDTGERIRGGVQFSFINVNPGFSYTVTAVGIDDFDPVLAVETQPGIGECNDDTPAASGSVVAVPDEGRVVGDATTAQVRFTSPRRGFPINITVGSYDDDPGRFVLIIEGLAIQPADELDGFSIRVPSDVAEEPLGVYMIARYVDLDPYLAMGMGDGLTNAYVDGNFDPELVDYDDIEYPLFECNDAGLDECSDMPGFPGGPIAIANGSDYNPGSVDAGLMLTPNSSNPMLFVFGSNDSQSTGTYAIMIIGTVPGEE
jgi:hypothetical protein